MANEHNERYIEALEDLLKWAKRRPDFTCRLPVTALKLLNNEACRRELELREIIERIELEGLLRP